MTNFLLIRHAVNDWVSTGRLAGWTSGVHLNDYGKSQAEALGERLKKADLHCVYSSPLERTVETAEAIVKHRENLRVLTFEGVGEVRYGDWQGKKISKLSKDPLWKHVQFTPSRVQFPNGETMRGAQMRAVNAIEELHRRHPKETIAVVSHSDVIKMILTHFLGMHLDVFQRINVSPASISTLVLQEGRPFIHNINDTSHNPPPPPKEDDKGDKKKSKKSEKEKKS